MQFDRENLNTLVFHGSYYGGMASFYFLVKCISLKSAVPIFPFIFSSYVFCFILTCFSFLVYGRFGQLKLTLNF